MEQYIYIKKPILDDILSCPICLEVYKHPRNLVCGHSFCTTCLFLIKINNNIICPICRQATHFTQDFLLINLPVNNIITSIIDNSNLSIKKKLKKSKSVDSFHSYKKTNYNKLLKYYYNIENNNLSLSSINNNSVLIQNNNTIHNDNINNQPREECCTFQ